MTQAPAPFSRAASPYAARPNLENAEALLPFRPAICAFLRGRGLDPDDADDLAQETLLRAYCHLGTYRGGTTSSWLCSIARNLSVDYHRRRRLRQASLEDLPHAPADDAGPETLVLAAHQLEEVAVLLAELRPAHQVILRLRYFEELSQEELAARFQCSPGAVRARVFRAVAALRRSYVKLHPDARVASAAAFPPEE